ncbi:MAG: hypothetical protein AAF708_15445 [Deinococcota bacterium]
MLAKVQLGVIGWTYFGQQETDSPQTWLELDAVSICTSPRSRMPLI